MIQEFAVSTVDLLIKSYVSNGFFISFLSGYFFTLGVIFRIDKTKFYPVLILLGVSLFFCIGMHLSASIKYIVPLKYIFISFGGILSGALLGFLSSRVLKPIVGYFERKRQDKRRLENLKKQEEQYQKSKSNNDFFQYYYEEDDDDFEEEEVDDEIESVVEHRKNPFNLEFDFDEK